MPTAPKEPAAEPLVDAVVRHGTVVVGEYPDVEHKTVGDTVRLSRAEVEKLRARGVLVDDARTPHPVALGPSFSSDDGPTIKDES